MTQNQYDYIIIGTGTSPCPSDIPLLKGEGNAPRKK
jgi:hypothetical protein